MLQESNNVKIVVFVPVTHADKVRQAIGSAGGGKIGNYTHCTFTSIGTGRFKPEAGANPSIGEVGQLASVEEERIEFVCPRGLVEHVVSAIKEVHPYEEVAWDMYPLLDLKP